MFDLSYIFSPFKLLHLHLAFFFCLLIVFTFHPASLHKYASVDVAVYQL